MNHDAIVTDEEYLAAARRALRVVAAVGDELDADAMDRLGHEAVRVLNEALDGVPFDHLQERVAAEVTVWALVVNGAVRWVAGLTGHEKQEVLSQLEDEFIERWGEG